MLLLAVLPFGAVLAVLAWSPLLVVRTVDVTGQSHVTVAQVLEASGLTAGAHPFLPVTWNRGEWPEMHLMRAERRIEKLPWVADARVDWLPLHAVRIRITERTPFACLPYLGGSLLLDETGVVLESVQDTEAAKGCKELRGVAFSGYVNGRRPDVTDPLLLETGLRVLKAFRRSGGTADGSTSGAASGTAAADANAADTATAGGTTSETAAANGKTSETADADGPDLYDSVRWVDVLAVDRVLVSLEDRITLRMDPTGDLQYMADFAGEIFFRHIAPQEKGIVDFTRGSDPAFIPE